MNVQSVSIAMLLGGLMAGYAMRHFDFFRRHGGTGGGFDEARYLPAPTPSSAANNAVLAQIIRARDEHLQRAVNEVVNDLGRKLAGLFAAPAGQELAPPSPPRASVPASAPPAQAPAQPLPPAPAPPR